MPWTPSQAPEHTKKASTEKKRDQWSKVANSVLKATGDEARAVRTANGVIKAHHGNSGERHKK